MGKYISYIAKEKKLNPGRNTQSSESLNQTLAISMCCKTTDSFQLQWCFLTFKQTKDTQEKYKASIYIGLYI